MTNCPLCQRRLLPRHATPIFLEATDIIHPKKVNGQHGAQNNEIEGSRTNDAPENGCLPANDENVTQNHDAGVLLEKKQNESQLSALNNGADSLPVETRYFAPNDEDRVSTAQNGAKSLPMEDRYGTRNSKDGVLPAIGQNGAQDDERKGSRTNEDQSGTQNHDFGVLSPKGQNESQLSALNNGADDLSVENGTTNNDAVDILTKIQNEMTDGTQTGEQNGAPYYENGISSAEGRDESKPCAPNGVQSMIDGFKGRLEATGSLFQLR